MTLHFRTSSLMTTESQEANNVRNALVVRLVQASLLLFVVLLGLRLVKGSAPSELLFFTGIEASTPGRGKNVDARDHLVPILQNACVVSP